MFLQTGIITEFSFGMPSAGLKGISFEAFNTSVARSVVDSTDIFNCKDEGRGYYMWSYGNERRGQSESI